MAAGAGNRDCLRGRRYGRAGGGGPVFPRLFWRNAECAWRDAGAFVPAAGPAGYGKVHYVLDKQGVHARTYLHDPGPVQLYARFITPEAVERLAATDDRPPLDGLTLVRRVTLPWSAVRRVRIWREGGAMLFFRPRFWQALAMRCPIGSLEEAEAFARKKLKRFKGVRIS